LWFCGESGFPALLATVWLLEREKRPELARRLLTDYATHLSIHQQPDSLTALADPYVDPDDVLKRIVESRTAPDSKRHNPVQSYTLLPLVCLMVRRGMRHELEQLWPELSRIRMTYFGPDKSWGYLEWHCDEGLERDQFFPQPQSWNQLVELAATPTAERLPGVLRSDPQFALMFLLTVPHRLLWSLIGSLDEMLTKCVGL
jgi:hypothetical protein